jgi:hypothetical protein
MFTAGLMAVSLFAGSAHANGRQQSSSEAQQTSNGSSAVRSQGTSSQATSSGSRASSSKGASSSAAKLTSKKSYTVTSSAKSKAPHHGFLDTVIDYQIDKALFGKNLGGIIATEQALGILPDW